MLYYRLRENIKIPNKTLDALQPVYNSQDFIFNSIYIMVVEILRSEKCHFICNTVVADPPNNGRLAYRIRYVKMLSYAPKRLPRVEVLALSKKIAANFTNSYLWCHNLA